MRARRGLVIGIVPVVLLALLITGWAVDTSRADVVRNVKVGTTDVGGRHRSELEASVDELAAEYVGAPVEIVTPRHTYTTTAGELGLSLDTAATVQAALDEGHDEPLPVRPFTWAVSLFRERKVDLRFQLDRAVLDTALVALQAEDRVAPIEPSIEATAEGMQVVPGTPGSGLNVEDVAARLPSAAANGELPVVVEAEAEPLPPTYTDAQAQAVADQASAIALRQLTVSIAGENATLPPEMVRSWARSVPGEGGLVLQFDQEAVKASLAELFPEVGEEPVSATFDVVDNRPMLSPGRNGTGCCEPAAAEKVLEALQANAGGVEIEVVVVEPELTTEEANALGIVEEVGQPDEFGPTTRHACCQPRVENIHRIADIVRGHIILPGETFSVNGFVGERTRARGFVDAPVIYQGRFETDIGGGVSQFATTLFNAAFFAGLDFGEYQSHSIEIDRYPSGREATISYPHPDLQLINNTPYGVLLWPTYTDDSITVRMYSTHNVDVTAGTPSRTRQGNCTRVTTPRTRTYTDGRVAEDSVFAVYRPGEGINC